MLQRPLFAPFDEGANSGGGRIKDIDPMALNDLPEAIGLGMIRRAFVHKRGGAI